MSVLIQSLYGDVAQFSFMIFSKPPLKKLLLFPLNKSFGSFEPIPILELTELKINSNSPSCKLLSKQT